MTLSWGWLILLGIGAIIWSADKGKKNVEQCIRFKTFA
jgi:hypothetical protein